MNDKREREEHLLQMLTGLFASLEGVKDVERVTYFEGHGHVRLVDAAGLIVEGRVARRRFGAWLSYDRVGGGLEHLYVGTGRDFEECGYVSADHDDETLLTWAVKTVEKIRDERRARSREKRKQALVGACWR